MTETRNQNVMFNKGSGARRALARGGFSAADEIEKLDRPKKAGSISDAEFARLRAKLVQ